MFIQANPVSSTPVSSMLVGQAQQNASNKAESVGELLNTIINVAGSLLQSSTTVADAITGIQPKETGSQTPAPSALIDQLRMIRYMLNEADGQLSRARSGLGA